MKYRLLPIILLACTVFAGQPPRPRLIEIPDHGRLRLVPPDLWRISVKSTKEPSAAIVHITPPAGDSFDVQVTSVWLDAARLARMSRETIKANVRRSADALLRQAVDKSVIMEELKGEQAAGSYFSLIDSNPAPGEYRYITQGSFLTGEILTAFTILYRTPDAVEPGQALRMFAGATHVR